MGGKLQILMARGVTVAHDTLTVTVLERNQAGQPVEPFYKRVVTLSLLLLRANQRQEQVPVSIYLAARRELASYPWDISSVGSSAALLMRRSEVRALDVPPMYNCNNTSSHNPTCKIQGQWRSGITPLYANVAQLVVHSPCKRKVGGAGPLIGSIYVHGTPPFIRRPQSSDRRSGRLKF